MKKSRGVFKKVYSQPPHPPPLIWIFSGIAHLASQCEKMVRKHKLGQKKVALFPEIGQVKNFLSPTHPHNKSKLKIKKNCTSQFICANLCFFPFKQGQIGLSV